MTTTVMRDSKIGDAWIKATADACPVDWIKDQSGNKTGNILTGPVRLCFPNLFLPGKADPGKEGKYGATLLFTPWANMQTFYDAYYAICGTTFPEYWDAASGQYLGLHSPFHDQGAKVRYGGYTPGLTEMAVNSKFKPPVVDANMNPIVDQARVYPGVWALVSLNAYPYGKSPPQPKKGVGFGIQSVMIICGPTDETNLGGAGPDPKTQFAGVNIKPPTVNPAAGFGAPAPGQIAAPPMAPPGAHIPSAPPFTPAPTSPPAAAPPQPASRAQTDCLGCGVNNWADAAACHACGMPLQ